MRKFNFRTLLFVFLFAAGMQIQAQDYLVSFGITGGTFPPDSVEVINLDQGTNLTMNGSDVLHLLGEVVGIDDFTKEDKALSIYPNPTLDNATIEFHMQESGEVNIKVCDASGKTIVQQSDNLPKGNVVYQLTGLDKGAYFVNVQPQYASSAQNDGMSAVIISRARNPLEPGLVLQSTRPENDLTGNLKSSKSNPDAEIVMQYNDGETLMFTAWYEGISAVEELIITESQTIAFEFIETVTDIEGNVYPVLTIGNQTWMQENLKTTKFNNGDSIPYILSNWDWTTATGPAVNWWNHDQAYADTNKMGALYNWYAVETGTLCPFGWHVPTNDEFEEFVFFLAANGYNYDGSIYTGTNIDDAGSKIGKSIAATSGWLTPTYGYEWSIGKYQHLNNSSLFNGIGADGRYMMIGVFGDPGFLCNWWTSTSYDADFSWTYFMYTEETALIKTYYFNEGGYSVRCMKDGE
nr:T9SS type A sorting domain-containing protein [Bacteroidota bacterium]